MTDRRFWNADGTDVAAFVLERHPTRAGCFTLVEQFEYRDPVRGSFRVPKAGVDFVTDLASVPGPAAWLVPKDGSHTPAALVHDALIGKRNEPVAYDGPPITRETADLIFREAMQHLEVPLLRRWMMWSAVSLATLFTPGDGRWHWYWRVVIPIVVGALIVIGFVSVLDVADVPPLTLPWLDDRPWLDELRNGFVAMFVAAVVAPLPWGRRWRVGLVAALALIPFAFPLLVAAVSYAGYELAETAAYYLVRSRRSAVEPAAPSKLVKRLS